MQNLKENWLLLSKMTWRICEIFTRVLGSLKIGILMGFLYPKLKIHEFKIYWGVMCHENEEWCKKWEGIDFSVQNWHKKFDDFWFKHSEISKICTLIGFLWPKYMMLELKKYKGVMFNSTEYWCETWRRTDSCFQKWHEEFGKFLPEHLKVSKFGLWWDSFKSKVKNVWA